MLVSRWLFRVGLVAVVLLLLVARCVRAERVSLLPRSISYYSIRVSAAPAYVVLVSHQPWPAVAYLATAEECEHFLARGGSDIEVLRVVSVPGYGVVSLRIDSPGSYYVFFYSDERLYVYVRYYGLPAGLASYPDVAVNTSMVLGFFNVSAASAKSYSSRAAEADAWSLQLNAVVEVSLAGGRKQYYWVQNMVGGIEGTRSYENKTEKAIMYQVWNNIWNNTGRLSLLSDERISGCGGVYRDRDEYYYACVYTYSPCDLPLAGFLVVRAYASNGAVHVDFGYVTAQSGDYRPAIITWYDNVTIRTNPPAVGAGIVATSSYLNGRGLPLNVELVFCGFCCSEHATFSELEARLTLAYWRGGGWAPFPNLYSFGVSTNETATNVAVRYADGFAVVERGALSPAKLAERPRLPALPMTSVRYCSMLTGECSVRYVYSPVTLAEKASVVYDGNRTRYVLLGYYVDGRFTEDPPTITPSSSWFTHYEVRSSYKAQHFVVVSSPLPVTVNGTRTTRYAGWLDAGSSIVVEVPDRVVLENGTLFTPLSSGGVFRVDSPVTVEVAWQPYYLVTVTSQYPVLVNGERTERYSRYLAPGTQLEVKAEPVPLYGGLVTMDPNASSIRLLVTAPVTLSVSYSPNYTRLVAVAAVATVLVAVAVARRRRRFEAFYEPPLDELLAA
ncbi:thermopsin [Thermofilum pendens]|uniref:Thermopsin n=1 Tax=Thermofilum pendens (strain DSM 2475 / Hrk 5) TaxID=368408 RepID=A1RZQ3_THEPD|nr:thermopsin [Thermofilum pendens]ABL78683.1 hypothetical protein Tpen_1285 [Thermofilum pendens Hrk 5]